MDVKTGSKIIYLLMLIGITSQRAIYEVLEDLYIEAEKKAEADISKTVPSRGEGTDTPWTAPFRMNISELWKDYKLKGRTEELVKLQLDMIISKDSWNDIIDAESEEKRRKRNAVKDPTKLWPRRIPYRIIDGFNITEKYELVMAMKQWEENTCLKFVEAKDSDFDVIEFNRAQVDLVCESMVGRAQGAQPINLAERCMYREVLVHEIGHALGLYHEHMRADRDTYVTIYYENIAKQYHREFEKLLAKSYDSFDKPYDYESIMHYGKMFFTSNRSAELLTIVPKDPSYLDVIGEMTSLSFYDVKIVNEMYKCADHCTDTLCPENGFLGQHCECFCKGNTTQDIVSCQPQNSCGKLDIDLEVYEVYTEGFGTQIKSMDRTKYPDGTHFVVQFKDSTCGGDLTNFTCVGNSWEGELPNCVQEKECIYEQLNDDDVFIEIPSINRVIKTGDRLKSGTQVHVVCRRKGGKIKENEEYIVCKNGTWSEQFSQITCSYDRQLCPMIINASVDGSFDDGFEVKCIKGYELETPSRGIKRYTCLMNGTWEPHQPVCTPARCRLLNQDINMKFYDSNGQELQDRAWVKHGSDVTIWCPKGHIPDDAVNSCRYGEFSIQGILRCTLVTCPEPPVVEVDFKPKKREYIYGDEIKIERCDKMLEFVGSKLLTCQKNGTWSDSAMCRTFCEKDIVVFEAFQHTSIRDNIWSISSGVGSYSACERKCMDLDRFLCRAFVFGYKGGNVACQLYPYSPEEYPKILEPQQFWTVGVRKCVPKVKNG